MSTHVQPKRSFDTHHRVHDSVSCKIREKQLPGHYRVNEKFENRRFGGAEVGFCFKPTEKSYALLSVESSVLIFSEDECTKKRPSTIFASTCSRTFHHLLSGGMHFVEALPRRPASYSSGFVTLE